MLKKKTTNQTLIFINTVWLLSQDLSREMITRDG